MTSIGLASGWSFDGEKQQPLVSGCAASRYVGGRYRIRTYDFHRVNLHIFNLFNSLHDTGRNTKSLEIQVRPNRALLTVHE